MRHPQKCQTIVKSRSSSSTIVCSNAGFVSANTMRKDTSPFPELEQFEATCTVPSAIQMGTNQPGPNTGKNCLFSERKSLAAAKMLCGV